MCYFLTGDNISGIFKLLLCSGDRVFGHCFFFKMKPVTIQNITVLAGVNTKKERFHLRQHYSEALSVLQFFSDGIYYLKGSYF